MGANLKESRGNCFWSAKALRKLATGQYTVVIYTVKASDEERAQTLAKELESNKHVVAIARNGAGFFITFIDAPRGYDLMVVTACKTFSGDAKFKERLTHTPGVTNVQALLCWW